MNPNLSCNSCIGGHILTAGGCHSLTSCNNKMWRRRGEKERRTSLPLQGFSSRPLPRMPPHSLPSLVSLASHHMASFAVSGKVFPSISKVCLSCLSPSLSSNLLHQMPLALVIPRISCSLFRRKTRGLVSLFFPSFCSRSCRNCILLLATWREEGMKQSDQSVAILSFCLVIGQKLPQFCHLSQS